MDNLKDLTHEQHKNAERSLFVKKMLKKELTPRQYYVYLSNQLIMYSMLEFYAEKAGVLEGIEDIKRSNAITKDLEELEKEFGFRIPKHVKSTIDYTDYIKEIADDKDKLLAHVYVRHMGDLSGGQILKKLIPAGSGHHYQFDRDTNELKTIIRAKLHDGLADEARTCFAMIKIFMEDLEASLDLGSAN